MWETSVQSHVGMIPWRRAWQPTPVFLSGESPWTEEPGGLQSMGSQRVRHDWTAKQSSTVSYGWKWCMSSSDMILKKPFCLILSFHVSWPEAERIFNSVWCAALYISSTFLLCVCVCVCVCVCMWGRGQGCLLGYWDSHFLFYL